MNTLNNQQINPGNRVDFSRIRRFSKGGIPKYQNTPGKLPYNWDWDGLNNAINNGGFGTATTSSLGYNKTFTPQGDIKTVADLEKSQDYTDFTDYVKQNATTDPKVMEYLKNLNTKSRKAGSTTGHLFDASGNLVQGWENIYNDLRNDGMYGAYHYSANKLQPENVVEDSSIEKQPTNKLPITTTSTQEFNTLQFLPKFQKSAPNTGYLHQIYRNNVDSINKQLDYALQQQVPETTAAWQNATTSSNYLQALEAKKQIAENRANYQQQVNSTGDIAKANAAMLDYDTKATNPALAQIYQGMSDAITETTQNVEDKGFANNQREIQNSNNNIKNRIAGFNNRLNALSTAEAKINAEESSFLNNRATVIKESTLHNKQEEQLYNTKAGLIMASKEKLDAYKNYLNASMDASNNADMVSGITLLTVINSMLQDVSSGNALGLTDDEIEIINNPDSEKYSILEVINNHKADLDEMSNSAVSTWISSYNKYIKDAELRWYDAKQHIAQKLAILGLSQHSNLSGTNDGIGVGINYQTLFPGTLYAKKGGKVEDRWSKYLQYKSKFNDTVLKALINTEKTAQAKLARDLDALDRETLLLLRSIFK